MPANLSTIARHRAAHVFLAASTPDQEHSAAVPYHRTKNGADGGTVHPDLDLS